MEPKYFIIFLLSTIVGPDISDSEAETVHDDEFVVDYSLLTQAFINNTYDLWRVFGKFLFFQK